MRRYETIFIIRPSANEENINALIERATGIIEGFQGSIVRVDKWGLKKLAYLIKKEKQGHYIYIEYAGSPEAVQEIERIFRIDDLVLKYMTVKTQEAYVPGPLKGQTVAASDEDSSENNDDDDSSDENDSED